MALTPTQDEVSLAAVAGSVLTSKERDRLVRSNKKLSNILGGGFQSSLLPLLDRTNFEACLSSNVTHRMRASTPFSDSSTDGMSILQIRRRSSCSFLPSPSEGSEKTFSFAPSMMTSSTRKTLPPVTFAAPSPSPEVVIQPLEDSSKKMEVPPLKLRPRVRRKSLSIAGVEMNLSERNALRLSVTPEKEREKPSTSRLTRSLSAVDRQRHNDDQVRPLPKVPPPPRTSSLPSSSVQSSPPKGARPLPSRPKSSSSSTARVLHRPQPKLHIVNVSESSRPDSPDPSHNRQILTPIPDESTPSPMMIDVEIPSPPSSSTLGVPILAFPTPKPRTSSLKYSRHTSVSSISTLALFPPPPTHTEVRKRKLDKMAKLTRILGDAPPPELVFGKGKEPGHSRQSSMDRSTMSDCRTPRRRHSSSLTRTERDAEFAQWRQEEKEKEAEKERIAIDDDGSDCMHSEAHAHVYRPSDIRAFPVPRTSFKEPEAKESALLSFPSRLRLRPRNKDRDANAPIRRVVSLNVDANAPFISLSQSNKPEGHSIRAKLHRPIPVTLPLSLHKDKRGSSRWLKEVGERRWEVESYGKVVRKLREL